MARLYFIIALALISTGCSSVVNTEQPAVLDWIVVDETNSIGQTFKAHYDGINGVAVFLEPLEGDQGELQLVLRENPLSGNLGLTSLPFDEISTPGFYHFALPVQADSNQQDYYLLLRVKGEGKVKIGVAPGDSYLNGALYQNGQPDNQHQMSFQLNYYPLRMVLGLAQEISLWVWYLLISAFLFIPPGWIILDSVFLSHSPKMVWGTRLAVSVGISLALYPIIFMLSDSLKIHLGKGIAWGIPLISLFLILWRSRKLLYMDTPRTFNIHPGWFDLTLMAVILIVFSARFWIIRMLEVPLWGDSLQHAMITQLILDNNGLFTSWQPYAPYYSLTTHFGFSVFSAIFAWISGFSGTQATLWMGQIINGLAIFTLYPLAVKLGRGNRWAGVGAIIVGGLISTLPAIYVNWGRFAQLAGQAILPVAIWLVWESLDRSEFSIRQDWSRILIAAIALTGMLLSYYRMPFYYATFIVVLLLFWGLPKWRFDWKIWGHTLLRLFLIGLVGAILFIPWGTRLVGGSLANAVEAGVTDGTTSTLITSQLTDLGQITSYFSIFLWVVVIFAIIWALVRKNWIIAALPLWFMLLIGYMAGAYFQLPVANMLQGFAILIAVYIPLALLTGWLLGQTISWVEKTKSNSILGIVCILIIIVAGWFGWQQHLLLDMPKYALVTPPDIKAMNWIEAQTPEHAYFLVQGFQYWYTAAGSDAGWWIPLLAKRGNMLPPQYAQFNEISQPADFTQRVVDLIALLQEKPISDPTSLASLCDWGITHIYHGQRQGQVGGPQLYNPVDLQSAPELFTRIYYQDRVSIFTLNPATCTDQP